MDLAVRCSRKAVKLNHSLTHSLALILKTVYFEGILPKGPYLPCVSMAGRALLAGYPRFVPALHVTGFPQTRENGKRPWIWNFVPGREKARNFGLESWKLTCDRENWFYEFCLTNEVLVTETQALVVAYIREIHKFAEFPPEVLDTTGPCFLSVKAKARIDKQVPVIISHMLTELKRGSHKIRQTWKLWS